MSPIKGDGNGYANYVTGIRLLSVTRTEMKAHRLAVLLCLLLTNAPPSVSRSQQRESQTGRGAFIDAKLTSDGKLGVFTFNRTIPIPSEYQRDSLIFSPAPKELPVGLITDRSYIGTYDLATGLVKILWMQQNTKWLPGGYNLCIESLSGNSVLIQELAQPRRPHSFAGTQFYLLDIKSGRLKVVPIVRELARRGREVLHAHVVGPDGTLLLETTRRQQPAYLDPKTPLGLWVRYPSGEYVLLDNETHFFPNWSSNGMIYYSSSLSFPAAPNKGVKVYDVKGRTTQDVDYRSVREREYPDTQLSVNGFGGMVVSRKIKGTNPPTWKHDELKINTDLLK
jgi:hypothetical protein